MQTEIHSVIPVLPSADIGRDTAWYAEKCGFQAIFKDSMYAVLYRNPVCIHLQWHAGTEEDPLNGGTVIRIYVKNIRPLFHELVQRGTVPADALKENTPWRTNEFGFFDLNHNAVFVMEDASPA